MISSHEENVFPDEIWPGSRESQGQLKNDINMKEKLMVTIKLVIPLLSCNLDKNPENAEIQDEW